MNQLASPRKITRHLLIPTSVCSQFVKLDGQLGWLAAPINPGQDGFEFHKAFGIEILPWFDGLLDNLETATESDLAEFYAQRRNVDTELTAYYSRNGYTGD